MISAGEVVIEVAQIVAILGLAFFVAAFRGRNGRK
jgi:hypothetical protein